MTWFIVAAILFSLYNGWKNLRKISLRKPTKQFYVSAAAFVLFGISLGWFGMKKGAHMFALIYAGDDDPSNLLLVIIIGVILFRLVMRDFAFARGNRMLAENTSTKKWQRYLVGGSKGTTIVMVILAIVGIMRYATGPMPFLLYIATAAFAAFAVIDRMEEKPELKAYARHAARLVGMILVWFPIGYVYYMAINLYPPLTSYFSGVDAFEYPQAVLDWPTFLQVFFFLGALVFSVWRINIEKQQS